MSAIGQNNLRIREQAAEVKIRAERRAGELLAIMEKPEGGRPSKTSSIVEPVSTFKEMGIDKKQSHRWLLGDANLNGAVNGTDFAIMATNFNKAVLFGHSGWTEGDFNSSRNSFRL